MGTVAIDSVITDLQFTLKLKALKFAINVTQINLESYCFTVMRHKDICMCVAVLQIQKALYQIVTYNCDVSGCSHVAFIEGLTY